ncbi:MAG: NADH-quinone oxidoreductase subunit NuoF [Acidobacteriota bacterium]|nr:MAG: NADH-quinone oxidoreductase subunit NuoF [Acidobacteriota bacterium]
MPIVKNISEFFGNENARSLKWRLEHGGYESARKALREMKPDEVTETVINSNLRGLGGAGFPTGRKWSFVPKGTDKPKYLAVNCDEAEPGTFKDKYIVEWDPHRLLEGIIICSYAVGIHTAYIYIRGEYVRPFERLEQAVKEAYAGGIIGEKVLGEDYKLDVFIHRGAGAYICGEETGLLESLEGKKGWPRLKPPFPALVGAFGCPTVINNVETLSHLPGIIKNGAQWFSDLGCERNGGSRLFALSGCVNKPGVYELPMGTPMKELIYEHGGGILEGRKLKAVVPGGTSSAVLTAEEAEMATLDFDCLAKLKSMAGSGAVIVLDEDVCMVKALHNIEHFFSHESCGQCTPCREGTAWVFRILTRIVEGGGTMADIATLKNLGQNMGGTSICALCEGAAMPLRSFVSKFEDEFEYYVKHKRSLVEDRKRNAVAV